MISNKNQIACFDKIFDFVPCLNLFSSASGTEMIYFLAVKVTKGQIYNGIISKIKCHQGYYLCEKFHDFMKKCPIL